MSSSQTTQTLPIIDLDLGELFPSTTPTPTSFIQDTSSGNNGSIDLGSIHTTNTSIQNIQTIEQESPSIIGPISNNYQDISNKQITQETTESYKGLGNTQEGNNETSQNNTYKNESYESNNGDNNSFVATIDDISFDDISGLSTIENNNTTDNANNANDTTDDTDNGFSLDIDLSNIEFSDNDIYPEPIQNNTTTETVITNSDQYQNENANHTISTDITLPINSTTSTTNGISSQSSNVETGQNPSFNINQLSFDATTRAPQSDTIVSESISTVKTTGSIDTIGTNTIDISQSKEIIQTQSLIASELDHDHPVTGLSTTLVSNNNPSLNTIPSGGVNIDAMLGSLGTSVEQLKPAPITLITQQPLLQSPPSSSSSNLRMSAVGSTAYKFIFLLLMIGVGLGAYYKITDPIGFDGLVGNIIGSTSTTTISSIGSSAENIITETGSIQDNIVGETGSNIESGGIISNNDLEEYESSSSGLISQDTGSIQSSVPITDSGSELETVLGTGNINQINELLQPNILISELGKNISELEDQLTKYMTTARTLRHKEGAKLILSTQKELKIIKEGLYTDTFDNTKTKKKLTDITNSIATISALLLTSSDKSQ